MYVQDPRNDDSPASAREPLLLSMLRLFESRANAQPLPPAATHAAAPPSANISTAPSFSTDLRQSVDLPAGGGFSSLLSHAPEEEAESKPAPTDVFHVASGARAAAYATSDDDTASDAARSIEVPSSSGGVLSLPPLSSIKVPTLPAINNKPIRPQPKVGDFEDPDYEDPLPSTYETQWAEEDEFRHSMDKSMEKVPGEEEDEEPTPAPAAPAAKQQEEEEVEEVVEEEDIVMLEEEEEDFDSLVRDAGLADSPNRAKTTLTVTAPESTLPLPAPVEPVTTNQPSLELETSVSSPRASLTSPARPPRVLAPLSPLNRSSSGLSMEGNPAAAAAVVPGAQSPSGSMSARVSVSEDDLKEELRKLGIIRSPSGATAPRDSTEFFPPVVPAELGKAGEGAEDKGNFSVEVRPPIFILAHMLIPPPICSPPVSVKEYVHTQPTHLLYCFCYMPHLSPRTTQQDVEGSMTFHNISVQYEETAGAASVAQRMVFDDLAEETNDVIEEDVFEAPPEYSVEDYEGSLSQANLGLDYEESRERVFGANVKGNKLTRPEFSSEDMDASLSQADIGGIDYTERA